MEEGLIEAEYKRMTAAAGTEWSNSPSTGKHTGLPIGYDKLGLSIGSVYKPSSSVSEFLQQLEQIATIDSSLVMVPSSTLHFTFLALTGHYWDKVTELPQDIHTIKDIIDKRFINFSWTLKDLRVVPGKNFLLLAGIPDEISYQTRDRVAQDLLNSPWAKHIANRYKKFLFPPRIWHTTLCRYEYEIFPGSIQALFQQYKDECFGHVNLGTPTLRAINYDWTVSNPI